MVHKRLNITGHVPKYHRIFFSKKCYNISDNTISYFYILQRHIKMDILIYSHILAIAEEKSISKAADKLFITRSALNRQLLTLEQEIGAPLFKRVYNSLELTEVGKIYVKTAEQVCGLINHCNKDIISYLELEQDKLLIGVAGSLSSMILMNILNDFHTLYPNVQVDIIHCNSNELRKKLTRGKIDLAIMTLPENASEFQYEILDNLEVLLLVSYKHPLSPFSGKDDNGNYRQCDLSWFKNDYFGLEAFDTPLRYLSEKIFFREKFEPRLFINNCDYLLLLQLASSGSCCVINSERALIENPSLIGFGFHPRVYLSHVIAYRNGYVLSKVEQKFLELVKKHYPKN